MSNPTTRIRAAGAGAGAVRDFLAAHLPDAQIVGDDEPAELVMMTADDFTEALEDAAAEAAYHRTRGQESVPGEMIDRLLAGDNPVKVWREHRGIGLNALADKAGIGRGYLSQIESGSRSGTVATLRKLAAVLAVDLDDLAPAR
jgi:DNA-binding XRE family transcriptional regulator